MAKRPADYGDLVMQLRKKTGISGPKLYVCLDLAGNIGIWWLHPIFDLHEVCKKPAQEVLEMGLDKACEWLETEYAIHLMKE